MDSKESRTIAVPVLTLEWWRQLAHDNPQDLPPRINGYLNQAEINRRAGMALNMLTATGEIDLSAADFSDALMWLKEGKRVSRAGWNGKGQFVEIWRMADRISWPTGANPSQHVPMKSCFVLVNTQGEAQPGWVPSMGDLLAADWKVVSEDAADAMPPELAQMLEELEQLSLRLKELNAFIEGEDFKMLGEKGQHLLKCQATHMADYQDVLVTRVAAAS